MVAVPMEEVVRAFHWVIEQGLVCDILIQDIQYC